MIRSLTLLLSLRMTSRTACILFWIEELSLEMSTCRQLSSVTAHLSPSTGRISITRHQLDHLNSPNWSHRPDLALRNPWGSSWLNLMSTQLSWRSWAAELTLQSTSIESVSSPKAAFTRAYRTPMLPLAQRKAVLGQEWKSLKREVVKRGCQQTLKLYGITLRRPVKGKMTMLWSRSAMRRTCLQRHISRLSSSKLAWRRRKLMSTKRCSLNRGKLSTWRRLHNSFSNQENSTTNQRSTTSSNVKTSRNGAHCLNLCSRSRSSYPNMPSTMFT